MRNEHKLIIKEINSIQREFKELVRVAQEQNALSSDFVSESVFEYTTDYSTETDDNVSCTEGDVDGTIHQEFTSNHIARKFPHSSHTEGSKIEDLVNFSKIVDEQRKKMFSKEGSHFLSTGRRGSSLIIELDRNRRLNGRLEDEGRHSHKKTLKSMSRRNSAMPLVQYVSSPRETRRADNNFDNQRVSSYSMHNSYLTQDHQFNSGYHDTGRNPVETSLKDPRQMASSGTSSYRRLESKRASLSIEAGRASQEYHRGHRRASEMLSNQLGTLLFQNKGRRWAPELHNSTDRRRTSVLLEEDENCLQGKRETNL